MKLTKAGMVIAGPAAAGLVALCAASPASAASAPTSPLGGLLTKTTQTVVSTTVKVTTVLPGQLAAPASPSTSGAAPSTSIASASATGLSVPALGICVSCTSASSAGAGVAHATGLKVLGTTLTQGSSGPAAGTQSGALYAIPANPMLSAAIADWFASTSGQSATSRAALADVAIAKGVIATVSVLRTESATTSGGAHAVTDGVDLGVARGALVIVLLHSESGAGGSRTYVARINGLELLGSDQLVGGIPITLPGIATINLLLTSAGVSPTGVIARVSNVLGTPGVLASVLEATTTSNVAHSTGIGTATGVSSGVHASGAAASAPRFPTTGAGAPTPMTGIGIGIGGLLLAGSGFGLLAITRRWSRRTR